MFFNEHGDRRYMCFIFIPIYSASIKKISKFIEFCKIAAAQRHSRRLHKEKNSPALRIYIRWTRGNSVLHIIYYHNYRFTQPSLQANSQMTMPLFFPLPEATPSWWHSSPGTPPFSWCFHGCGLFSPLHFLLCQWTPLPWV